MPIGLPHRDAIGWRGATVDGGLRPFKTRLLALGTALFLTWTPLARADVVWEAPAGCSSSAELTEGVARALGRTESEVREIDARASVERSAAGYRVRIEVAGGERTVEAGTCSELVEATALILALTVDPRAAARQPAPSERLVSPAPPPAPARKPKESPIPGQRASKGPFDGIRLSVGVEQLADVGTLPSPSLGIGLFVGLNLRALRIELGAGLFPPQTERPFVDMGGEFSRVTGSAMLCYQPTLGRLEVGGCMGAGFDRVGATAVGTGARAIDATGLWSTLDAEGRIAVRLTSWLAVRFSLGAHAPLSRPSFAITGAGEVYRPSAVSARQALGLEIRFP